MLLEHPSIDVNAKCKNGKTALSLALDKGYGKVVNILLEHPLINIDTSDNN